MKSKFKNLSFNNEDNFQEWLEKSTYMLITFLDLGQDMLTMHVHESGEMFMNRVKYYTVIFNHQSTTANLLILNLIYLPINL